MKLSKNLDTLMQKTTILFKEGSEFSSYLWSTLVLTFCCIADNLSSMLFLLVAWSSASIVERKKYNFVENKDFLCNK